MPRKQIWSADILTGCKTRSLVRVMDHQKELQLMTVSLWPHDKGVMETVKPHMVHLLQNKTLQRNLLLNILFNAVPRPNHQDTQNYLFTN